MDAEPQQQIVMLSQRVLIRRIHAKKVIDKVVVDPLLDHELRQYRFESGSLCYVFDPFSFV